MPQAPCTFSALEAPASLTWPFPGPQAPVPLPSQMASVRLALSVSFISADTLLLFEYNMLEYVLLPTHLLLLDVVVVFSLLDF